MSEEEIIKDINQLDYTEQDVQELLKELENDTGNYSNYDLAMAIIYYKNLYKQEKEKNKKIGKLVKNKIDGKIGIVLRECGETGQIQVLEKIQPKIINTHDSWKTLEVIENE